MSKNKLPEFETVEEFVDFFDTHDMGKYWDEMPEAHFKVTIKERSFLVAVDETLIK